ncbi:BspA family leucine-rich repeat surface protein [Companilactobacillus nodensis]|nr:BspA family leucine-rich repeat surface protein [Companilactobacillus nodensis]
MVGAKSTEQKKHCTLRFIIILSGIWLLLCAPQVVKADDVEVMNSSDLQGMLNENSSVVQNAPVNTIAPLVATITDSGTFGTCDWDIDDEGLLTIHAGVLGKGIGNWVADGRMNDDITNVVCDPGVVANENSGRLFFGLKNVQTIDVTNLDTSNVVDMSYMFACSYNDANNSLHQNVSLINIIGLNNLDTSKVQDMHNMFYNDIKLVSLDVSSFDTSNVTDMNNMFFGDSKLVELSGLDKWDTGKVQDFSSIFNYLPLTSMSDIEKWDMSSAVDIGSMFSNMRNLTTLDLSAWDVSNVEKAPLLFYFCDGLTSVKGLDQWNYHKITDIRWLFYGNTKNQNIRDIEGWDTSNITNMNGVFDYCLGLDYLDLSGWDTSNVTDMTYMFHYTPKLTEIKGITNFNTSKVTKMGNMFANCGVPVLDLSSFDTSKVVDMSSMFYLSSNKNIIGDFDTSNVTNMNGVFSTSTIPNFEELDLNVLSWDVSKCRDFGSAFSGNPNLTSLDLSQWNPKSATSFNSMFSADPNLKNLDVSTWETPNLTSLNNTFYQDTSLEKLYLSSWNTSKVTNMSYLFSYMTNLAELDISNWDTGKVTSMLQMFAYNPNLWKLSLGPKTQVISGTNSSGTNIGSSFPTPPAKNTEIIDPTTENKYYSISPKWQEVDYDNGGSDHEPVGALRTSSELNTIPREENTTYVWQQQPYMDVSMDVPDLSYGTASANQGVTPREQDSWAITLNNNVYPATTLNTTIAVSMETPLANDAGDTLDDSFIFRDNTGNDSVISTTPTTIYDGKVTNGVKNLSWDSNHGFLMNLHSFQTPMGTYSTTLDWTMVNSI